MTHDWYIRCKNENIKTLNIAADAEFYICQHWLGIDSDNAATLRKISLDQFSTLNIDMDRYICYLYIDNNVVTKIVEQFTP